MGVGPDPPDASKSATAMSLFGALNTATSGLRLIQGQIGLVSENVARSDDPNRTRHTLEQTVDKSGGVSVAKYSRQIDRALRAQLEATVAEESGARTTAQYMRRVVDMLGATNGKPQLQSAIEDFQKAWTDLDTTPESAVAQGQVVQSGEALGREIRRLSQAVEDLEIRIKEDISNSVADLNTTLTAIDRLNVEIVTLRSGGEPTMAQEDQRDALIRDVAGLINIRVIERADGRAALFTPTGLAVLDASPTRVTFDGQRLLSSAGNMDIGAHMREGKLGAMFEMIEDNSGQDPAPPASRQPTAEVFRKLRSQLDGLSNAFLGSTRPGEPTSFTDAYNSAGPAKEGELERSFFTGTDRFSITINPAVIDGGLTLKSSAFAGVAAAMTAVGRNFLADGVTTTDVSYAGMAASVITHWTTNTKSVEDHAKVATDFKDQLTSRYHSQVGINLDEEIANLQVLQRNYTASARVMQVVNTMFDALEGIVR